MKDSRSSAKWAFLDQRAALQLGASLLLAACNSVPPPPKTAAPAARQASGSFTILHTNDIPGRHRPFAVVPGNLFTGRRRNRRVSTAAERLRPSSAQPGQQHGYPGPLAGIKPRQNAPAACALPAAPTSTQSAELPAKRSQSRQSCPHQSTSRRKQHRSRFWRLVSLSLF
jgi:hypothetical protein